MNFDKRREDHNDSLRVLVPKRRRPAGLSIVRSQLMDLVSIYIRLLTHQHRCHVAVDHVDDLCNSLRNLLKAS
jgi:hypothetical protein